MGTSNIDIDARKSAIKGGQNAFMLNTSPSKLGLVETQVTGAQVFDARESQKPRPGATIRPGAALPPVPAAAPKPNATAPKAKATAARFDGGAATAALDKARDSAEASCKSSTPGKKANVMIDPGFLPEGTNANAAVRAPFKGTPEGLCVEGIFKKVKIPPFEPSTLAGGMMRYVTLH